MLQIVTLNIAGRYPSVMTLLSDYCNDSLKYLTVCWCVSLISVHWKRKNDVHIVYWHILSGILIKKIKIKNKNKNKLEKVDLVITDTPAFQILKWKEWKMLWFTLHRIHFMAITNLQILVIDNVVNFYCLPN